MADQANISLRDDVLRGCAAIAEYIGEDERRTFSLLQRGLLPAQKEGAVWVSRKTRLDRHYELSNTPREHQRG